MPSTDPPAGSGGASVVANPAAPSPSEAEPFEFACPCLNVSVESLCPNNQREAVKAGKAGKIQVYLPKGSEKIKHIAMATFDKVGDEQACRKCWVCDTRVYFAKGKDAGDLAPVDAWVEVDLGSVALYGDKLDEARQKTPLPYCGLLLDLPATSTFGRPPQSTTPVIYPSEALTQAVLLPPIPDPFFLPPPFIPSHPALREMCKAAVETLHKQHDQIERDVRAYIAQRAAEMKRLEDQVRSEVETLWARYAQGPLGGKDTDRRGSIVRAPAARTASGSSDRHMESIEQGFERADAEDSLPSGVKPDPPSIQGQFNHNTAIAASSLLSASLVNNTFHAPPPRNQPLTNDVEQLAKTASRDRSVSREQAMSYAFSAMDEHVARRDPAAEKKADLEETEAFEEDAEEREKGIDSWAAMERSQAALSLAQESGPRTEVVTNGSKEKKTRVTFQEPSSEAKDKAVGEEEDETEAVEDDEDYVFDMETDADGEAPVKVPQPEVKAPNRPVRTMVEDNLSRTFAADAPSHRAAWRAVEAKDLVWRREAREDGDETDTSSAFARSVPINVIKPRRVESPLQRKTSLTEREGRMVPSLIDAMRERGVDSQGHARTAPRAIAGSIGKPVTTGVRRSSRSASGDRERELVKSFAADPGAMFESLAEGVVDEEEEETAFVPPHVLAQRAAEREKASDGRRRLSS